MERLIYLTNSSGGEVQTPVEVTYELWQIIFWYSAFAVAIILFVIYLTSRKTNKKKLDLIVTTLQKANNRLDNLIKSIQINSKNVKKVREESHRISTMLSSFDVTIIELKEKTRLEEFDKITSKCLDITKDLKKIRENNVDEAIVSLQKVQQEIIALKGQVELIKTYIH